MAALLGHAYCHSTCLYLPAEALWQQRSTCVVTISLRVLWSSAFLAITMFREKTTVHTEDYMHWKTKDFMSHFMVIFTCCCGWKMNPQYLLGMSALVKHWRRPMSKIHDLLNKQEYSPW